MSTVVSHALVAEACVAATNAIAAALAVLRDHNEALRHIDGRKATLLDPHLESMALVLDDMRNENVGELAALRRMSFE